MKKIISLLLLLTILFSTVGCQFGHVHEFVFSETTADCLNGGVEISICSCGEKQETEVGPLGHDMRVAMEVKPTCTSTGSMDYRCVKCGKMEYNNIEALGHTYEEEPSEPSRVIRCINENCDECIWGESNDKHKEALTFSFTKDDEAAFDAKFNDVLAMIKAADKYDPSLHQYAEEGALADEYASAETAMEELYDLVMNVLSQESLAEVAYYCDMDNSELESTFSYMKDYGTAVIAKFYTLSRPLYDSCYREFYYYDMTEEEINAFLFESDAIANPEYTALEERNNAIEVEVLALSNPQRGDELPMLYAEFAANNNKMAQLMGYDNYLEYAYKNVYGRGYTYDEVKVFSDYVKRYISPIFASVYKKWNTLTGFTEEELMKYNNQVVYPFFENLEGNTLVNDYIDLLSFTSNPEKTISFSDEFNKLMRDGNMFRGEYDAAYVTTVYSADLPIAYFGKGYDNCFTVVHEFGHFMNEIYSAEIFEDGEYRQSYDILEMHSQGNELLYLCYLEAYADMPKVSHTLVETYSLVNMLYAAMMGMTIDSFEQAIYLNEYDGTNADVIMADGKITYDEYDLLYSGICADYGVEDTLDGYWRGGMTVMSPCYYVSYSVSALSVLQLYQIAQTESFDVAKDAYLKLFTYVDENPDMTVGEILDYAGLLSYSDEELYVKLNDYLLKK